MVVQNTRERRRSTRNKTIFIDYKPETSNPLTKFINVTDAAMFGEDSKNSPWKTNTDIEERTIPFKDLMKAFKNIDSKRSTADFDCVNDALKRFKTDDEHYKTSNFNQEKMKIESEIFPKISENIFFRNRNEQDVSKTYEYNGKK